MPPRRTRAARAAAAAARAKRSSPPRSNRARSVPSAFPSGPNANAAFVRRASARERLPEFSKEAPRVSSCACHHARVSRARALARTPNPSSPSSPSHRRGARASPPSARGSAARSVSRARPAASRGFKRRAEDSRELGVQGAHVGEHGARERAHVRGQDAQDARRVWSGAWRVRLEDAVGEDVVGVDVFVGGVGGRFFGRRFFVILPRRFAARRRLEVVRALGAVRDLLREERPYLAGHAPPQAFHRAREPGRAEARGAPDEPRDDGAPRLVSRREVNRERRR